MRGQSAERTGGDHRRRRCRRAGGGAQVLRSERGHQRRQMPEHGEHENRAVDAGIHGKPRRRRGGWTENVAPLVRPLQVRDNYRIITRSICTVLVI